MSLPTLRIDCDGPISRNAVITLDGQPVPGLRALTLRMEPEDLTVVELTIAVDHVDVSAEALAELTAHLERTEPS